MIKSKVWDWSENESDYWLKPCIESFYLVEMWKAKGFKKLLDLGCGYRKTFGVICTKWI
ncbi:hypothetical protein [Clostridium sp. BL-8]|uniref:hypothetical protein n=1 Tax=Clostridium sp. BL-8 TaxID=349938 RepID=UPI0009CDCA3B|nr:hypothetical protein [Clostridium sp. BL-8]OOM80189.1 hypothetical protein CLOBL_12370 [Clostridium sp. BL-8]